MAHCDKFLKDSAVSILPPELVGLVCRSIPFRDLCYVAAISQVWWHAACSILWRRVNSLEYLLRAALGEPFDSDDWPDRDGEGDELRSDVDEEDESEFDDDEEESYLLGTTFGPENYRSLCRVAHYVQQLNIYDTTQTGPLYLGSDLLSALVNCTIRSLLPRLRWLSIGAADWTDPFRSTRSWPSRAYDLDLLGLFLSDCVERLVISSKTAFLDVVKLKSRAPSIQQLYILLDAREDNGPYGGSIAAQSMHLQNWPRWTMERLSSWRDLSTLSFSSHLLTQDSSIALGKLAMLTKLTIKCVSDPANSWQGISFEPGSFAQLDELAVERVNLCNALALFQQPELMGGLTSLKVVVTSDPTIHAAGGFQRLLATISHQAPSLRRLHYHSSEPTATELQPITSLSLTHLTLSSAAYVLDAEPLLLSLNPDIEVLTASRILAPASLLADLAPILPNLHVLHISLTVDSLDSLTFPELETRFDCLRQLVVYFHDESVEEEVDMDAVKSIFVCYIRRLWKGVKLRLIFP